MTRWMLLAAAAVSVGAFAQEDTFKQVASFDAKEGQLPEGLYATPDAIFVALAAKSQVLKVALPDGAVSVFGDLPTFPAGKGFVTGVTADKKGNLYVALASFTPETKGGIYKLGPQGGKAELWATDPTLALPNGLAWDKKGNLLVTDSISGVVFSISPKAKVEQWVKSDLLKGDRNACPPPELELDVGANGIAVDSAGNAYVNNTDHGTVVKIPSKGGKAGTPEVYAGPDCATLEGADGLTLNGKGELFLTANRINKLVKIGKDKKVTVLATGGQLDFPATPAFGTGKKDKDTLYISNFALLSASKPGGTPHPGVLALEKVK